jgi:hypothetical protein
MGLSKQPWRNRVLALHSLLERERARAEGCGSFEGEYSDRCTMDTLMDCVGIGTQFTCFAGTKVQILTRWRDR